MLNWGIIGAGRIAGKFAMALHAVKDARLHSVAARELDRAELFARQYGANYASGSYEEMLKNEEIQAVYIATPHSHHMEHTLMALDAGKHVLCEKAFAHNSFEVNRMIDKAREKDLFLMEAMWMRFLPAIRQAQAWIAEGVIGELRMLHANFCAGLPLKPDGRVFNKELAGGALLDVGIYPIALSYLLFGREPEKMRSHLVFGETGVDESGVYNFFYENGAIAQMSASIRYKGLMEAHIVGEKGEIHLPYFWKAESCKLIIDGEQTILEKHYPHQVNGLEYEAAEATAAILKGMKEHPWMPLKASMQLMHRMDKIRADWKFEYPNEQKA